MADASDHPMVILQMAQEGVAARAMAALHRATAGGNHERHGAIGDAHYHLRWLRPSLLFPADAPDTVRMGLTIEGGVVLASGRILSVDAFLTATAPPDLIQADGHLVAQLPLHDLANGQLNLSYAGQPLPPAPVRPAQGLPSDVELDALIDGLRATLADWLGTLPALPLTPPLPTARDAATRIAPDGDGAAFALCFPDDAADAPLPILLDHAHNTAILLNASAIEAAFAEAIAPRLSGLMGKAWSLDALTATLAQDRVWFAAHAQQVNGTNVVFSASIAAIPYLADGQLQLSVESVTVGSLVGQEVAAERFVTTLATPAYVQGVATALSVAIREATAPFMGTATAGLGWQWGTAPTLLPFTGDSLDLSEGWLALAGMLPAPTISEDLPELLAVDLHVGGNVEPLDGGQILRVTVVAAPLTPVTLPNDCAWWNAALPQTLLLEHSASLAVELRVAEDDPHDTLPRHLRTRPLPIGLTTVRAALVDAFGRVALAEHEIDLRDLPADVPATINLAAAAPTSVTSAKTILTPAGMSVGPAASTLSEIPTRTATAYTPVVRQAQARSSLMGMLAGALAVFAIFAIIASVILTRSIQAQGQTPQPTATLGANVTTPVPQATVTPLPGKTPTPVPDHFGVFAPTPDTLVFACSGGHAPPQTLTMTNSGTATIGWQVKVYGGVTTGTVTQPWASVAPASGTLAAGQSAPLTVTVPDAFCSAPNSSQYLMQFTTTSGSAVPRSVPGSHT